MPDDLETQLATSKRREAALAGVLRSVAAAGEDVPRLMHEIVRHAVALCGGDGGAVFLEQDGQIVLYTLWPIVCAD